MLGAERQLLTFGVIPALIGWAALSLMLHFNAPALALFLLLAGFLITIVVETIGRGRRGCRNYLALRWGVSIIVLATLSWCCSPCSPDAHGLSGLRAKPGILDGGGECAALPVPLTVTRLLSRSALTSALAST